MHASTLHLWMHNVLAPLSILQVVTYVMNDLKQRQSSKSRLPINGSSKTSVPMLVISAYIISQICVEHVGCDIKSTNTEKDQYRVTEMLVDSVIVGRFEWQAYWWTMMCYARQENNWIGANLWHQKNCFNVGEFGYNTNTHNRPTNYRINRTHTQLCTFVSYQNGWGNLTCPVTLLQYQPPTTMNSL